MQSTGQSIGSRTPMLPPSTICLNDVRRECIDAIFGPHFFPFSEDGQDDNNEDELGNATVVSECLDLNDDDNASSLNDDNDDDDNDGAHQRQQEEDEEEKEEEDSFIFSTLTNNCHDADSAELPCRHKSGSERSLLAKTHSDSQVTTTLSLPEPQPNSKASSTCRSPARGSPPLFPRQNFHPARQRRKPYLLLLVGACVAGWASVGTGGS